ncbi:MAG: bifunctional homocysteine S-methyltransferase/methylenetetrahydrofolate reductase [Verrucomicrobia bacterium]|nr:bifunctional homocysteine S-methyltransferase/methylenetetrahydrofolate reductase [Verrucomicrobiota bacterium]
MNLLEELEERIICGDGAMGTLLLDQGLPVESCLEEICVSDPDRVLRIHEDYIAAGARVIETDSFGANAVRLRRFGFEHRVREFNTAAAKLATQAAAGKDICVAGSVGPLGLSAIEAEARGIDRAHCFHEQIEALLAGGVNAIFLETFMDESEMEIALAAKNSLSDCTTICTFACEPEGRLASGAPIATAFAKLRANGAHITGANCMNGPNGMVQLFRHIPLAGYLAAYPNAGYPKYTDGRFTYHAAPEYFAQAARELAGQGARLIGGCCGTNPRAVAAIARAIAALAPVKSKPVQVVETAPSVQQKVSAQEEESLLDKIAAGKRIVICELDPPKTLSLDRYFCGAQQLMQAGCDAITLADNSLAILRVSNLAIGAMLKERFGITPLLHLSCRDKNVLGLQSELLGMAALGMRHVLPLTGDPARVGDHPNAASVYDVNSIELISIIRKLNEGFTHAGKSLKTQTRFVTGCTFNPNARNMDAQVDRLERKVAAGAAFAMTQPVFEPALVEQTKTRTAHLRIPVFIGVWPLRSAKQANFLHNEVPGIVLPEKVRARMNQQSPEAEQATGLAIAEEMITAIGNEFPGVYLITPFLHFESTCHLAKMARQQQPSTEPAAT